MDKTGESRQDTQHDSTGSVEGSTAQGWSSDKTAGRFLTRVPLLIHLSAPQCPCQVHPIRMRELSSDPNAPETEGDFVLHHPRLGEGKYWRILPTYHCYYSNSSRSCTELVLVYTLVWFSLSDSVLAFEMKNLPPHSQIKDNIVCQKNQYEIVSKVFNKHCKSLSSVSNKMNLS